MIRRLPVLATLLVLAAVALMVWLGFWQLDRMREKEALLARYEASRKLSSEVPFPRSEAERPRTHYRHSTLTCTRGITTTPMAGRSFDGASGWAHMAACFRPDGASDEVVLGWSRNPAPVAWAGGTVYGMIAPGGSKAARLVVSPPQAGLAPNAVPDPREIPNNHFSYAVQWFLFSGVALVIFALAVRGRLLQSSPERGGGSPQD